MKWREVSPTGGLGVYMRTVAARLHPKTAMTLEQAARLLFPNPTLSDTRYAQTTLERLEERMIARRVKGGCVRGENWRAAADRYGWKP